MKSRTRLIAVLAIAVAGITTAIVFWAVGERRESDQKFHLVKAGVLYRSRQPDPLDTRRLARRKIVRVINLRERCEDPREFDKEKAVCRQAGVAFLNLPMGGVLPSDAQLETFLRTVTAEPGATLVHCAQGRSRTGTMSAIYLVVVEGWTLDRAMNDLIQHGDRSDSEKLAQKKNLLNRLAKERQTWLERIKTPATQTSQLTSR